ncbi:MAG: T9SS type A sorting domain-containing protein [Dysgonamonadaceae bacterium]|nr:T9SS type A sorting domain-containing protein [Dysgonamonadaceae bacterium]
MKKIISFLIPAFFLCFCNLYSQQYKVNVTGYIISRDKNLECHTRVQMTYYYSSGSTKYEEILLNGNHDAGRAWTFSKEFLTNEKITGVKCVGIHADNPSGPKSCYTVGEGSDYLAIPESAYPCVNIRLNHQIIGKYDNGSYVNVKIEPVSVQISYHNSVQYGNDDAPGINFLHENIPVSIKATSGYPTSVYKWEYSIGNTYSWASLDNRYMNGNRTEITLKATDLLSYEQIMYKTPVYIRINCNCDGFKSSNRIDLQPKIAAPTFKAVLEKKDESCPGNNDGEIIVEFNRSIFSGETIEMIGKDGSGLFFSISHEMIGGNRCRIYNLPPGTITFQLTGSYIDQHGDRISTGIIAGSDQYSLTENIDMGIPPSARLIDFGGVTCPDGDDGWVIAQGEGGSGEYKLICENADMETFESGFSYSEVAINALPVGEYYAWIADSKGCLTDIFQEKIIIGNPENPISIENVSLFNPIEGENTGSISVSVKNGTPPYTSNWRKGNSSGEIIDSNIQTGGNTNEISTLTNQGKGTYYVEFTDANGCRTHETIFLDAFPVFDITMTQTANIHCYGENNGELSATINSGGSGIYTKYEWYTVDNYQNYYPTGYNSPVISNITGGKYRMKVTDSEGNQSWSEIVTVTQPNPMEVSFNTGMLQCRGDEDGLLVANISGGAGNYSWNWEYGLSGSGSVAELNDIPAGTYQLSVEDQNGCHDTFYETVSEPAPMSAPERITPPSCAGMNNGSIQLNISGGTPEYILLWDNGGTSSYAQNLTSGYYSVTITDRYGCETIDKTIFVPEPEPLIVATARLINVSENGKKDGSILVRIEGGTIPYRATCSDEQDNRYTVPGILYPQGEAASLEIRNLPEGNYTLFIQDRNYQTSQDNSYNPCTYTVEFSISEPPPLIVSITETHHITCNDEEDGELSVQAEGGTPFESEESYSYKWYRQQGASRVFIEGSENKTTIEEVRSGAYLVEVIDKNNVSVFSSPYTLTNPPALKMQFQSAVLTCASDSIGWVEATVTGGRGGYTYEWAGGETGSTRIENKPGGWYALSVEDMGGCKVTDSTFISSPQSIQITYDLRPPLCDGHGDAYISMIISGGEAPYNYSWSNGETTAYLDDIYPGSYDVRITDDLGCFRDTIFTVPDVIPVIAKPEEIIPPLAFGYSDGSIRISISGGELPYSIRWENDNGDILDSEDSEENGIVTSIIQDIPEGNYHLFIQDNQYQDVEQPSPFTTCGCLFDQSFYMPEPPKLELEIENTKIIRCFGSNDGAFEVHAKGGVPFDNVPAYSYQWYRNGTPTGTNDNSLSNLGEGYYYVVVSDANNISIESGLIFLKEPQVLSATATAADLRCSRDTNGWAQVEASGGTTPYQFNWSNGETSSRIENIPRGKYFVYITDSNGCEIATNTSIAQLNGIKANATLISPACHNGSDGEIQLDISGGEAPYHYEWENGQQNLIRNGLQAGNYSITITDANNCAHEVFTYTLSQPDSIVVDLGNDIVLCEGQSREITATIDEDVRSYAWFNPSGIKLSGKQSIIVTDPGIYQVEVITGKGCRGAGNIRVEQDNRIIANEFLVASQAPLNDNLLVVNITDPTPDSIEWIVPEGEGSLFEVIENSEDILNLIFKQYGYFTIGMVSYSGNCTETVYKTVQVMDKENISGYEDADEPILRSFSVHPNPNPGYFETLIEVKDNTPLSLQLIDSGSGKIIERRILKGKSIYKESFNITGNEKGTYLLNLYGSKTKSTKKVILK